jgi:hypothetical protein
MTDDADRRRQSAFLRRNRAARYQLIESAAAQPDSTDEDGPVTNYGKGLTHREDGVPTVRGYDSLVTALATGTVEACNAIDLDDRPSARPLANPSAARGFAVTGVDPHHPNMRAPPATDSPAMGAELVELYWRALCRDVPFGAVDGDDAVAAATTELGDSPDTPVPGATPTRAPTASTSGAPSGGSSPAPRPDHASCSSSGRTSRGVRCP